MKEFADKGFTGGSLDRIAAAAGVSKGALYRYFQDKEDFFTYLVDESTKSLGEYVEKWLSDLRGFPPGQPLFVEALKKYMRHGFQWGKDNPLMSRFVLRNSRCPDENCSHRLVQKIRASLRPIIEELFKASIAAGEIKPDFNREAAAFLIHMTSAWIIQASEQPDSVPFMLSENPDIEKTIEDLANLMYKGIANC